MAASATFSMHRMALEASPFAVVLTDPAIEDNPIVFVNRAFTAVTGYPPEAVLGRNCRFLQGPDTDPQDVRALREGVRSGEEFSVEILNYKADGRPFLNRLHIAPLNDEAGDTRYLMAIQRPAGVSKALDPMWDDFDGALREVHHRVKNHLSMVVGLIRMQARVENANSVENYTTLARRIETLQMLYQEMTASHSCAGEGDEVGLAGYISRIAATVAHLDGREGIRLNVDARDFAVPIDTAAQVGLLTSELLTNAYQHAFDGAGSGLIDVRLQGLPGGIIRLQVSDDGAGIPPGTRWPDSGNLGGRIVRSLLTGLDATLSVNRLEEAGTIIAIDVPAPKQANARPSDDRPPQPERLNGAGESARATGEPA